MEQTKLVKEFTDGLKHFYDCIDFGNSNLDAEAIRFMNEMPSRICNSHDGLVKACEKAEQLMESMLVPMGIKKEGTRPNNVLKLIQQALEVAK